MQQKVQRRRQDQSGGVRADDSPRAHHQPAGHELRHREAAGQQVVQPKRLRHAGRGGHGVGRGPKVRTGRGQRQRHHQSRRRGDRLQRRRDENAVSDLQKVPVHVYTACIAFSFWLRSKFNT